MTKSAPVQSEELNQLGLVGLGLIHEMGNPITATLLGLELLKDQVRRGELSDPEAIADHIGRQISRVRSMAAVVSRFRQWMHKEEPYIEALDPVELSTSVVRMLRASLDAMGRCIPVIVPPPKEVTLVKADQILLERSLSCVLINATDAIASRPTQRGDVRVSFWHDDEYVGVVVEDNGPGFESIDVARHLGETSKAEGMGVGLALVDKMMSVMGGRLHLSNRATAGACVTLALPRA